MKSGEIVRIGCGMGIHMKSGEIVRIGCGMELDVISNTVSNVRFQSYILARAKTKAVYEMTGLLLAITDLLKCMCSFFTICNANSHLVFKSDFFLCMSIHTSLNIH